MYHCVSGLSSWIDVFLIIPDNNIHNIHTFFMVYRLPPSQTAFFTPPQPYYCFSIRNIVSVSLIPSSFTSTYIYSFYYLLLLLHLYTLHSICLSCHLCLYIPTCFPLLFYKFLNFQHSSFACTHSHTHMTYLRRNVCA